jgi:multiple sugar transport system permease protein
MSPKARMRFWRILYTVIVGATAITMVLPFVWMISTSFKIEMDVFNSPVEWIPRHFNPDNYRVAWTSRFNFPLYYGNTIKVSILTTILQVSVSAMAGYAFAKIRFSWSKPLFLVYLATLMIPTQVTIIPSFIIFKSLGLINKLIGIILISSFSVYGVFLLKQFMSTVPDEMSEAARIDGANHGHIFARIMLPIVKPAIATLAMLKFIWTWNDYQNPLVFLSNEKLFTLQLGMRAFSSSEYGNQYALMMAASVLAMLPLMAVFLTFQRFVIEGIALGAVKG